MEDSMSDDVFMGSDEDTSGLKPEKRPSPHRSPTGYRDYRPPTNLLKNDELAVLHKTILLGDSGVGKTTLLVRFNTGQFQGGNFSATVGIGFTSEDVKQGIENGTAKAVNRRTTIAEANNSNSALSKTQLGLSHLYASFTEVDRTYKLVILGDSGVGKTCLLLKFRDNTFLSGNFISTVGIDYRNKIVDIDGTKVKLQIWDTAGQERFRSVTHAYYRDAHALLLLYDVTNKSSFDNIRAWLAEIKEYAQDDVVIMLLGNKTDCKFTERAIRKEDGEKLAAEYNVTFMETSAKTGINVNIAFTAIARELLSKSSNAGDHSSFKVDDYIKGQTQKSTCMTCNS